MLFHSVERFKQDFFHFMVKSPNVFPLETDSEDVDLMFHNLSDFMTNYVTSMNQKIQRLMQKSSQGIFFINSNYKFEEEYSQVTLDLLGVESVSGQRFNEFFKTKLPQSVLDKTDDYFQLMFNIDIPEEDIDGLNPLKHIEIPIMNKHQHLDRKQLEFQFFRVSDNRRVHYLLAFITDLEPKVELEEKLHSKSQELDKQFDIFFNLMTVDPAQFEDYLLDIKLELENVQAILKKQNKEISLKKKLTVLLNASKYMIEYTNALGIKSLLPEITQLHEHLSELKEKTKLVSSDLFSCLFIIDELEKMLGSLKNYNEQFIRFKQGYIAQKNTGESHFQKYVSTSAQEIFLEKPPSIKYELLDMDTISAKTFVMLQEITTQLLEFSNKHSFKNVNKPSVFIKLSSPKPGHMMYVYYDNGIGLEYEDLNFIYDPTYISETLFFTYFNRIRDRARALHPKITVDSVRNEFFEFTLQFLNG